MKTYRLLLGLSALSVASVALADVSVSAVIKIGDVPPPPTIVVEPAQPGPPPWAPAHGRRAKHAYYYYPGCDVYYRPADRMWIFLDGGKWSVGASLPGTVRLDLSSSISLEMDTDRPYIHHEKVRSFYPISVVTKAREKATAERGAAAAGHGEGKGNKHDGPPGGEGKGHGKKGKGKGRD